MPLHHLILRQPLMRIRFHRVRSALVDVFDKAQVQRPATILVALELGDRGLGGFGAIKTNHSAAS